jgi:hypothetical protein
LASTGSSESKPLFINLLAHDHSSDSRLRKTAMDLQRRSETVTGKVLEVAPPIV